MKATTGNLYCKPFIWTGILIGQSILGAAILLAELEQPLVAQFTEGCLKNVNLHFSLALTRSAPRTRFLLGVKCGSNSLLVRFLGAITKAARDVSSVAIKDLIRETSLSPLLWLCQENHLWSMQVIYQGKTTANLPRGFKFPRGFEISQNLLKMKLLTLRDKVSVHYVESKRK